MNYCEKCGKEILETDIYCPHCGNKVINPKKNKNQRPLEIAVISFLVLSIVLVSLSYHLVLLVTSLISYEL